MKILIDGTLLQENSALVDQAVNIKSGVPDECHIFLMAEGSGPSGVVHLCGRDDKVMVRVASVMANVHDAGMVLIHAESWQRLMAECKGKSVTIETDEKTYGNVSIKDSTGKGKAHTFALTKVMPADQYVPFAIGTVEANCHVDKNHLRDALHVVRPTADAGNSFAESNGVCMEFEGANLRLIATNHQTLGLAEIDANYPNGAPADKVVRRVPRETLDLVEKLITATGSNDIIITTDANLVSFSDGTTEITTKVVSGGTAFVNWKRMVPDATDGAIITVKVGMLAAAMNRAEITNGGMQAIVDIHLASDGVKIRSTGSGGTYEGEIEVDNFHGTGKYLLDSKLVKSALKSLEPKTELQIARSIDQKRLQVIPSMPNIGNSGYQLWGILNRKEG